MPMCIVRANPFPRFQAERATFFIPQGFKMIYHSGSISPPYTYIMPMDTTTMMKDGNVTIVYEGQNYSVPSLHRLGSEAKQQHAVNLVDCHKVQNDIQQADLNKKVVKQNPSLPDLNLPNVDEEKETSEYEDDLRTEEELQARRSALEVKEKIIPKPVSSAKSTKINLKRRCRRLTIRLAKIEPHWGQAWLSVKKRCAKLLDITLHGSEAVSINFDRLGVLVDELEQISANRRTGARDWFVERLAIIEAETSPVTPPLSATQNVEPLLQTEMPLFENKEENIPPKDKDIPPITVPEEGNIPPKDKDIPSITVTFENTDSNSEFQPSDVEDLTNDDD